ncbi:MAG: MarR family winged helix-turn-helix transcriptional regulator, partial [Candidatus Fimadaptatus sp.]
MSTIHALNKLHNEISGLYHDISLKLGLADSESIILYMLYDSQADLTQSDIAKATGLSNQTLNSAVKKLERAGIIELEKLNEKSKRIVVTGRGRELLELNIKPLVDMEERVFDSWTEADRLKYLELTERFKVQFEREVSAYGKE